MTHTPIEIKLQPLSILDAENMFGLWSDQDAVKFTNWPYISDRKGCEEKLSMVLQRYASNPLHFGPYSILAGDGVFAGVIGADIQNQELSEYEAWYFLNRKHWGRGIARAALKELLEVMRSSDRVDIITATAVTENPASWNLLEKNGFQRKQIIQGGHQKHGLVKDLYEYTLDVRSK